MPSEEKSAAVIKSRAGNQNVLKNRVPVGNAKVIIPFTQISKSQPCVRLVQYSLRLAEVRQSPSPIRHVWVCLVSFRFIAILVTGLRGGCVVSS